MIGIEIIILILVGHWFCDFVLQSHYTASNKSNNFKVLLSHVTAYTVSITAFMLIAITSMFELEEGSEWGFILLIVLWGAFNGLCHLATDYTSSKITSRLYQAEDFHNFFVVIGLDQFAHYAVLFYTWNKIVGI